MKKEVTVAVSRETYLQFLYDITMAGYKISFETYFLENSTEMHIKVNGLSVAKCVNDDDFYILPMTHFS